MPLILGANSLAGGGYNVANSLRFNSGSSDNLTRTPASATNRRTFTVSFWHKKSVLSTRQEVFSQYAALNNNEWIELAFNTDDTLFLSYYSAAVFTTNQLFRDVGAWYHIVLAVDTTQATSADRIKLYVNGSQVTSFSSITYPAQNYDTGYNQSSSYHIGDLSLNGNFDLDGYLAEYYSIDGTQLTPTSFGETDFDSGIWKPKAYTGSFGTNGFYLEFKDSSALGDDTSGNGNDFTVNNLTSVDQSTDTCTNNFATLNPLVPTPSATWSQGNLRLTGTSSAAFDQTNFYTIGVDSGKWYTEVKYITAGTFNYNPYVGVAPISSSATVNLTGAGSQFVCIRFDNEKYFNGSATGSYFASSISVNDIIQVALDMDNGKVWFGKNGTFIGSPTAGTSEAGSGLNVTTMTFVIRVGDAVLEINSGNPPFTISSGNADGNNFGNFEYAVPAGYFALCTKNLAQYG